jgi:hypothetical protein
MYPLNIRFAKNYMYAFSILLKMKGLKVFGCGKYANTKELGYMQILFSHPS